MCLETALKANGWGRLKGDIFRQAKIGLRPSPLRSQVVLVTTGLGPCVFFLVRRDSL